MRLLCICAGGRRPRSITVCIVPPGDTVEIVVLIHRGEGVTVGPNHPAKGWLIVITIVKPGIMPDNTGPERLGIQNVGDRRLTKLRKLGFR